ncbi:MAG: hypothetical protein RG740_03305, partial [Acholeplasmataceae bacterium]|nr:hypothetical protein [Acholeplasmataceae bacterium]
MKKMLLFLVTITLILLITACVNQAEILENAQLEAIEVIENHVDDADFSQNMKSYFNTELQKYIDQINAAESVEDVEAVQTNAIAALTAILNAATAQNNALAELDDYVNMSGYSDEVKDYFLNIISNYKTQILDVYTLSAVNDLNLAAKNSLDGLVAHNDGTEINK